MTLRRAGALAAAAVLAGGGCFGRCVDATVAPPGIFCSTPGDCIVGVCQVALCVEGQCRTDAAKPGTPCDTTVKTKVCDAQQQCVKCRIDGVKNDPEGGVDCGASCDALCADNTPCTVGDDCQSRVCLEDRKLCAFASCSDNAKNGSETDLDCGGSCPAKCADGKMCMQDADCQHGHCVDRTCCAVPCDGVCLTCAEGACSLADAGENPGGKCPAAADTCDGAGHCKSCTNGQMDPGETDVDCGGGTCPPCAFDGGAPPHCKAGADCATCACDDAGTCVAPACSNGVQDGCETDIDCGGPWCGATCTYGQKCNVKEDCLSKFCDKGQCGAP